MTLVRAWLINVWWWLFRSPYLQALSGPCAGERRRMRIDWARHQIEMDPWVIGATGKVRYVPGLRARLFHRSYFNLNLKLELSQEEKVALELRRQTQEDELRRTMKEVGMTPIEPQGGGVN